MGNKLIGSTFIIAGTTIGAGMLAQPIISAQYGFLTSFSLLIFMWIYMGIAALYTVELSLKAGEATTIPKLMHLHFGKFGGFVGSFCLLLLFYALLAAYISGASSILTPILSLKTSFISMLYVLIFGLLVMSCIRAVDLVNRGLFIIKIILFLIVLIMLLDNVEFELLDYTPPITIYTLDALPLFIVLFGFHGSIPVLLSYLDNDLSAIRKSIFYGTLIPFILFTMWFVVTLGVIPMTGLHSFETISQAGNDLSTFIKTLNHYMRFPFLEIIIHAFTFLAITTSFLGVAIGLFDYFMEFFLHQNKMKNRLAAICLTFIIPLFFALFYPQGFVLALGYAGIALAMLAVIMPIMISFKLKPSYTSKDYVVFGGWTFRAFIFLIGLGIIFIELYKS